LLVLLTLLAACGDDTNSQGSPDEFAEFDQAVEDFLALQKLPGASAVVVHKERGVVHERGYGSFAKERLYLVASGSKILSAGVLMRLADQKLVDLDAPISMPLASWGDFKMDLSLASLLSNSSGLVSLVDDPLYGPYICQYIAAGKLSDCAKSIYSATDSADRKPPDTVFNYGGGQWQLAGGIAEVVSGKSWAELIRETYVTPCGASSLGYANHYMKASESGDSLAYPPFFQGDLANLPATENPSIEGGAYVTVGDYAKVLLMHLQDGRCGDTQVLSATAVARMREDRIAKVYGGSTSSANLEGYGLGWWIDRQQPGVVVDPGAYGAVAWLDLERDYGAFVALEATSALGERLRASVQPVLESTLAR
jgi:CubicO group peptidase (beta-lactamase class C family)